MYRLLPASAVMRVSKINERNFGDLNTFLILCLIFAVRDQSTTRIFRNVTFGILPIASADILSLLSVRYILRIVSVSSMR